MNHDDVAGSQDEEIVSATIWDPARGWGPFYDEPGEPIEDPRQRGFGHFDKIARQAKGEGVTT